LRLVAHIAKKYSYTGKDVEDLISIGTVGLIKAIEAFDISKGVRLATYAARCIENEISLMDVLSGDEDSIFEIVENKMKIQKLLLNSKIFNMIILCTVHYFQ
jgi:RNA polymerase sporulation-specific sigma factor